VDPPTMVGLMGASTLQMQITLGSRPVSLNLILTQIIKIIVKQFRLQTILLSRLKLLWVSLQQGTVHLTNMLQVIYFKSSETLSSSVELLKQIALGTQDLCQTQSSVAMDSEKSF
jgi:hypothetical protein